MIVLIDNYDSFTFNLFHYLGGLGADVVVHRNDKIARRRGDGARSRRHRAVARPLHAERCRHLPRPDRQGGRDDADPGRLPRPSGDRAGLRRRRGARAGARCTASCPRSGTRAKASFAASMRRSRRRAIIRWWSTRATLPADLNVTAETDDKLVMGLAHRTLAGARRAVPSRKHRVRAWPSHPAEFPRHRRGVERLDRPATGRPRARRAVCSERRM